MVWDSLVQQCCWTREPQHRGCQGLEAEPTGGARGTVEPTGHQSLQQAGPPESTVQGREVLLSSHLAGLRACGVTEVHGAVESAGLLQQWQVAGERSQVERLVPGRSNL